MRIISLNAIQVLDSRGNPTLQVDLILEDGSKGSFQVPSGASTGIHEAHELRDHDVSLYGGKSVYSCVENVEKLRGVLYDIDFTQRELDDKLNEIDSTPNKEVLGANVILGVSCAFARAAAMHSGISLYEYLNRLANNIKLDSKKKLKVGEVTPFANIINGGLHASNKLQIQEFMIVPNLKNFDLRVQAIAEIYQVLKGIIKEKYGGESTAVGDEGGFAPNISNAYEALDLLNLAVEKAGYKGKIFYAMDAAASDFYDSDSKKYEIEIGKKLDYKKLTDYYNDLISKYPIVSIEDPMAEDDFVGFEYFMKNKKRLNVVNPFNLKKEILVVGDDLLVTNVSRIEIAQKKNLCNSLLLKINQIGSLSEAIDAFNLALKANWHTIVSHRSGETTDDFISDLSIALNSSIKLGAPCRGERTAKYNRLLNIYSRS